MAGPWAYACQTMASPSCAVSRKGKALTRPCWTLRSPRGTSLLLLRASRDKDLARQAAKSEETTIATLKADIDPDSDAHVLRDTHVADSLTELPAEAPSTSGRGKVIGSVITVAGLALLIGAAAYFQEPIRDFLVYFSDMVDDMGFVGMVLYTLVYTGLEILAVPAIPLTMTAGAIFGIVPGALVTSLAGTLAATVSFLIARYVARDKFLPWAQQNKKFRAVDKVIQRDGLKVVTLLRLSPLLPLAASNYLYGLTSVKLPAYFVGSWLGMLPGTIAYVCAGHVSKSAFISGEGLALEWWQVGLAVLLSVGVIGYIGQLAKQALAEMDDEDSAESSLTAK